MAIAFQRRTGACGAYSLVGNGSREKTNIRGVYAMAVRLLAKRSAVVREDWR
jgi:hypothetical protein